MFRSITFNGTDKKQIGAPIIRRTNEMISEFDLQYERNYKIVKIISQRELEFQEYLKEQEARQYRLDNLIKILRGYFKENNYNENTYYALFKPSKRKSIRRRRKRKKKVRPKTAEIKRNKYLFYKVTRNNYIFNKFKPYLYPLTNKEKKDIERKIYTDANLKEKSKGSLNNMSPAQLKQFVDVFGFIPMVFHKEDQDKEKKGNKFKIVKCSKDGTYYSNTYFSCPVCTDEYECKYCSSYINDKERCTCCIRRKLEIMPKCGLKFMDKTQRYEFSTFMEQSEAIKCFLIPYFSFVLFVGVMSNCLFYKIKVKRDEDKRSKCLDLLIKNNGYIFITVV